MTRRTLQPLAFFAASLALAGGAVAFAATAGPAKGDAAAGKKIFSVKCIACHKADGTGGIKLTGNPTPNWKDPKVWNDPKRATDDYFRDCITNGKAPSGMVAWGKTGQIKPPDIENLISYIRTLGGPAKGAAAPAKGAAAATKK